MKCPFRVTTTHTEKRTLTTYEVKDTVEYADCYGIVCPYYCKTVSKIGKDGDEIKYTDDCLRIDK